MFNTQIKKNNFFRLQEALQKMSKYMKNILAIVTSINLS